MKCKFTEKKNMKIMLAAGLVMMALGAVVAFLLPDEAHLATRIAGVVCGGGSSLAAMAGVILLRRVRLGEARARDAELAMNDERGIAVAYKAQSVMALAAVFALVVITLMATVRGDTLYMGVCTVLLCVTAAAKLIAWHVFNRTM